ncbi:MAG: hypothetical protein LBQ28_10900 [Prevotellaceae bacterium]|jgi:hypothetical protein|nr:hypothetical protein [Prevotellaceae bacterium]
MTTNNSSKITLSEALLYNPHDSRYSYRSRLRNFNFSELIEELKTYGHMKDLLLKSITYGNYDRDFTFFTGYSGTGKTTFLYWFKEQIGKDNYYIDIINLIVDEHGLITDESLIKDCLKERLLAEEEMPIETELFKNIIIKREIFLKYFYPDFINEVTRAYQYRKFSDIETKRRFLDKLGFEKMLIFYLLNSVLKFIYNPEFNSKKSYTICFDNLDELLIEHLAEVLQTKLIDIHLKLNQLIVDLGLENKKIYFIIVCREANYAVITAQRADAINAGLIPFENTGFNPEIFRKRCEKFGYGYNTDEADLLPDLVRINNASTKQDQSVNIFFTLFNYSYRRLALAMIEICRPQEIDYANYRLFSISKNEYDKIPDKYIYGKRGILMNSFIRYLAAENFLDRIAPRREVTAQPHCNCTRMFLTVLFNISYPNGFKISAPPPKISLHELYKRCKDIMKVSEFLKIIKSLVDFNKSSWAHLITIYGKQPERINRSYEFDFDTEGKLLLKKAALTGAEQTQLDLIKVSINPSAYIYLKYIYTHFEYISAYRTSNGNSIYHYKPLFQLTKIENYIPFEWKFQKQIESVYDTVKTFHENTNRFFHDVFQGKLQYTKEKYCRSASPYIFKSKYDDTGKRKYYPFYMTRLITSHIRYLDDFRLYITQEGYENILSKELLAIEQNNPITYANIRVKEPEKIKEKINVFIIGYIEKYIVLLEKMDDPAIKSYVPKEESLVAKFKTALEKAKEDHSLEIKVDDDNDDNDDSDEI